METNTTITSYAVITCGLALAISNVRRVLPLLILGLLSACATRNVYFPADHFPTAAAEHAADHIIDAVTMGGEPQP